MELGFGNHKASLPSNLSNGGSHKGTPRFKERGNRLLRGAQNSGRAYGIGTIVEAILWKILFNTVHPLAQ